MKKYRLLIPLFLTICISSVQADSWDDFGNVERMWDGQKSITNQQFEQVMEKLEEKGKQKESKLQAKKRKKLFGTGTTLHTELNPDGNVQEIPNIASQDKSILINIPVNIFVNGNLLEKGYYNVFPEQDSESGKKYVTFYQSQFLQGKLEITETEDDYGEDMIDFAKILPYNDKFVKLIFGSVNFNGYAYIPYVE